MASTNELRVFISSTFRDMQDEREHLIKKIFPEIRALCRERGVAFTEVDLRWGLTEENQVQGQVIRTCLEEIDRCRPYFVGITGSRYGYVPSITDIHKDPDLLPKFPWIEDAAMDEASIIDMEFRHAVLNDLSQGEHCRFFFRDFRPEDEIDEMETERLDELKVRVRATGLPVREFSDSETLGQMVYEQLQEILERDFAAAKAPSPLEQERSRHEAFAASRRHAYIPNVTYLKRLNQFAAGDGPPLIVYAESGSGKSALLAYWAEQYRRRNQGAHVIEHYVGIGASSTGHFGIMRHIMAEIKERFSREEDLPTSPEEIERGFPNWLGFTRGEKMLVLLDGINQLSGVALNLGWLPRHIPSNIRLVITSTVEQTLIQLREREWEQMGVQPLTEAEREAIIVRFLGEYRKGLAPEQVHRIAGDVKCAQPLFLRTMLEELRLFGVHELIDGAINRYLETTGPEDLFQVVLERLEKDFDAKPVRDIMALLWAARAGLTEIELAEITSIPRMQLSALVMAFDYNMVRNEGALSFFHDYLRRAVEKRYLGDERRRLSGRLRLAAYFERTLPMAEREGRKVLLHVAGELTYQLAQSGEQSRLKEVLGSIPVLVALYQGETQYEVLAYWKQLGEKYNLEEVYRESLDAYRANQSDSVVQSHAIEKVASIFEVAGHWDGASDLYRELIDIFKITGDRDRSATVHRGLGVILWRQGRFDEAMELFNQARDIYEEIGDQRGIASAVGNMGLVYFHQQQYQQALECFSKHMAVCEELCDRRGKVGPLVNMGAVYYVLSQYAEALDCFRQSLVMSQELGNRRDIAAAMGNMGRVYTTQGNFPDALDCYRHYYEVSEELGDRMGAAIAMGDMGMVYSDAGEYPKALECLQQWMTISEELGDRRNIASAATNMGIVYIHLGDYTKALECFHLLLSISEELGDRFSIAEATGKIAEIYGVQGKYQQAIESFSVVIQQFRDMDYPSVLRHQLFEMGEVLFRLAMSQHTMPAYLQQFLPEATDESWRMVVLQFAHDHASECIHISEELATPDTHFSGRVLLAKIEAAMGDVMMARQQLHQMFDEAEDNEQRALLHYELAMMNRTVGDIDVADDHGRRAIGLFEALYAAAPRYYYKEQIADLQNTQVPQ
jgi:tetratricopeptide (TPR) repeat protein